MNVKLISNNNDDDNNGDRDKVEKIKEVLPTLDKTNINVIITNNEVRCPPLLSPNKAIKSTDKVIIGTNKNTNDNG